jgi:hypothetical protein
VSFLALWSHSSRVWPWRVAHTALPLTFPSLVADVLVRDHHALQVGASWLPSVAAISATSLCRILFEFSQAVSNDPWRPWIAFALCLVLEEGVFSQAATWDRAATCSCRRHHHHCKVRLAQLLGLLFGAAMLPCSLLLTMLLCFSLYLLGCLPCPVTTATTQSQFVFPWGILVGWRLFYICKT